MDIIMSVVRFGGCLTAQYALPICASSIVGGTAQKINQVIPRWLAQIAHMPPKFMGFSVGGLTSLVTNTGGQANFLYVIASGILVPAFEETIYRFGMQRAFTYLLIEAGIPSPVAKTLVIGLVAFIFTSAHGESIETPEGSARFLRDFARSAVFANGESLYETIGMHVINNLAAIAQKKVEALL